MLNPQAIPTSTDAAPSPFIDDILSILGPDFESPPYLPIIEQRETQRYPLRKPAKLFPLHHTQLCQPVDSMLYDISRNSLGLLVPQETALGGDWVVSLPKPAGGNTDQLVLLCSTARISGSGTRYDAIGARILAVLVGNQTLVPETPIAGYRWVLLPGRLSPQSIPAKAA